MIRTLATFAATYALTALGAAVGIGRWLRSNEPAAEPFLPPALWDACVPDEPTPIFHAVRAACVRSAAWDRLGEFGDEDLEEWYRELLNDDGDYSAAECRDYRALMERQPMPTDLGDL